VLPDVASVVIFVLIVAPGIVFELSRQRRRPARSDSAFVEASRVLLAGVMAAAGTLVLLGLARLCGGGALASPSRLIDSPGRYTATYAARVGVTAMAYLVIASTLAALAADLLRHGGRTLDIVPDSAWVVGLSTFAPVASQIQVSVTMQDGTTFVGIPITWTTDPATTDREMILTRPLYSRGPNETETTEMASEWACLVLAQRDIASLAINYVVDPTDDDAARSSSSGAGAASRLLAWLSQQDRWRKAAWCLAAEILALFATSIWIPG
jgi:Family of unknown function (DUF6338)